MGKLATADSRTCGDRNAESPAEPTIEHLARYSNDEPRAPRLTAGAPRLFAKWARDLHMHSSKLPRFDPQVSVAARGGLNIAYYRSAT